MFAGKLFQAKGVWSCLMTVGMSLLIVSAMANDSSGMKIAEYVKLHKDSNIVAKDDYISFYGVMIIPDQNKDWETEMLGCSPIVATYGKHKIIDPGTPSLDGDLENDLFCAGNLIDFSVVAMDFPEKGMISMALDMADLYRRGAYTVQLFTVWQGKIVTTRYYGMGSTNFLGPLGQVFGEEQGLVPTWNALWDICGLGEKCPHICFQCPGCVANTVHYIAFSNGKWAYTKPGEFKTAYRNLYDITKGYVDKFAMKTGMSYMELFSNSDTQGDFLWYLSHLIYYSVMEGLSDAECMERLKQYTSPECGREFLSQIREDAVGMSQIQMTTEVY